jgi:superfamily II RNA helicase
MSHPLLKRLPAKPDSDTLLDAFLDYVSEKKLGLYPAQEEAILELYGEKNVILNTPTGSGKSLVATALHFKSLAEGKQSFYTSPIKALVNEKFLALCRDFGPENVGMITGDASVNPEARIICCTAEILAIDALRLGKNAPINDVIMDEFHYYADRDRGVAWQIPLLTMPQTRFLLISATLGETDFFQKALTDLNQRETSVISTNDRPVPLDFQYWEIPLHEAVIKLVESGRAPVYLVNFTQRECAEVAQSLMSVDFCTKDEKRQIAEDLLHEPFKSPYGKEIQRFLKHGLGVHHAGLLPRYRVLVEKLAQKGRLKVICGTDTLGVGVNIPIRTVLFTKLCKYDGEKTALLSIRDFKQISGRAGRKGFDDSGTVISLAPEHVIENLRGEQKAAGDPKKMKKLVKKRPPEGLVVWNKESFEKMASGIPETLVSRFKVNHSMLLNVLGRDEDGCKAMRQIIQKSHESDFSKVKIRKSAFVLFRSLIERGIIQFIPVPERQKGGRKLRLNIDLQSDFSLNQTLSLYLLDTLKLLSPTSENYALDVVTLVESILENPDLVLRKQLDVAKRAKLDELKLQGVDYDDRIAQLEDVEYPKPNREFIYSTFNEFAAAHPWIGQENIRPKSIAREMFELCHSFGDYIREYDLHRGEGVLLRYLSDFYKTLVQNVPDLVKNDDLLEITQFFGQLVRDVDSSLLDEWERLKNPGVEILASAQNLELRPGGGKVEDITTTRTFKVELRNWVFRLIRRLSVGDFEGAAEILREFSGASTPKKEEIEKAMSAYFAVHHRLETNPSARDPKKMTVSSAEDPGFQIVQQILTDPENHADWILELKLDLARSRELSRPVLLWQGIREAGQIT